MISALTSFSAHSVNSFPGLSAAVGQDVQEHPVLTPLYVSCLAVPVSTVLLTIAINLMLNVLKYSSELFPGLVLDALSVHYCSPSNILPTIYKQYNNSQNCEPVSQSYRQSVVVSGNMVRQRVCPAMDSL